MEEKVRKGCSNKYYVHYLQVSLTLSWKNVQLKKINNNKIASKIKNLKNII